MLFNLHYVTTTSIVSLIGSVSFFCSFCCVLFVLLLHFMDKNKEVSSKSLLSWNGIPIIDLELKDPKTPVTKSWILEKSREVHHALSTKGFVFLTNHGVSEERINSVHKIMETFCALPDDVKHLYTVKPPTQNQGYVPVGSERLYSKAKTELKHAFNIQSITGKLPIEEIPNFKNVIEESAEEFLNLTKILLRLISAAQEIDPEVFLSFHKGMMKEDNITTLRMLYYPPLEGELSENVTRCGEHCDWGTFTLLAQDTEGGLELFDGEEWSRVGHLPGAILMNVADMLETWSGNTYKSVRHRVVVPENSEGQAQARHSIAFFVIADDNTPVDSSFFTRYRSEGQLEEPKTNGCVEAVNALQYIHQKLNDAFKEAKL